MKKPVIGITCNYVPEKDGSATLRIDWKYSEAIRLAGGIPLLVPLSPLHGIPELLECCDGLLFSGGGGLQPHILEMDTLPGLYEQNPVRHEFECALAKAAIEGGIPVMGVCRGHQTLNEVLGGTLKNLDNQEHLQQEPGDVAKHAIRIEAGSLLAECAGQGSVQVNSFHRQRVEHPGRGLRATAFSPEGFIEAIEGEGESFILGVQFHPEFMMPARQDMTMIYVKLVEAARKRATEKARG